MNINDRPKGQFPLSIGTSLAIESLLGVHSEIHHPSNPLSHFDVLYVNLRTLFRNIYTSFSSKEALMLSDNQLIETLFDELSIIDDVLKSETNMALRIFAPQYTKLEMTPEVLLRLDNTELQKIYTKRMVNVTRKVIASYNQPTNPVDNHILIPQNLLKDKDYRRTLMMTNFALDLCARRQFKNLALLETHTGKIKPYRLWYTKYYNGNKLPEMPFRLDLLTIMGDTTLYRNKNSKIRDTVIEIAKEKRWTPVTTTEKILSNFREIKNPAIRTRLLNTISDQYF